MVNELEKNELSTSGESSGNRQGDFSGSKNALPLAMGTLVEAIDLLQDMLQGEKKEESSNDHQGRYIAVSLASRSIEKVGRGIRSTVKTSGRLASLLMLPGRVVAGSRPFRPARNRFDKFVERGREEVDGWKKEGQEIESHGRKLLRQTISENKGKIINWLGNDLDVEELIKSLADNYIAYLNDHPELIESLIQEQGDVYINYLNKNPEQVQGLIQRQSTGLVSEVTDEVRERTVTADTYLEMLIRSLFRRGERAETSGEILAERELEVGNDFTDN